jgi:prevent-host-death family protein
MYTTNVRTMRDLRNKTAEIMQIVEGRNQVIITKHGKGAAVIVDFAEFEEYEKYIHEKYVEVKLAGSLQESKDPNTKWLTHEQAWDAIRSK